MRLIKPSYKILTQGPGLQGIYEQIELAGRTCYASSHKIQYQENETCDGQFSTTAKDFVDRMIASKHYAMLEHGTVYLKMPIYWLKGEDKEKGTIIGTLCHFARKYYDNSYSKINIDTDTAYITTNYRVLVENGWLDDLQYLCEPTEYHEKRVTVRFTTDRGVSHEFVRHRVFSFAQESTRYCNYSKDKFGNELTFIIPSWMDISEDKYNLGKLRSKDNPKLTCMVEASENGDAYNVESPIGKFLHVLDYASDRYMELISEGWTPQQARQVLPNALKTELVMTGFVSDWQHFFSLRTSIIAETGQPHPDAAILADPLYKEFINRNYIQKHEDEFN